MSHKQSFFTLIFLLIFSKIIFAGSFSLYGDFYETNEKTVGIMRSIGGDDLSLNIDYNAKFIIDQVKIMNVNLGITFRLLSIDENPLKWTVTKEFNSINTKTPITIKISYRIED